MKTFTVDIPVDTLPPAPWWERITVRAESAADARKLGTAEADARGWTVDRSRDMNVTWAD